MTRFLKYSWAPCVVASWAVVMAAAPRAVEPIKRTVYVTASDSKGAPVTDLVAADIQVKEGGKEREVASVTAPEEKLDAVLMVQDNLAGEPGVRLGLAKFGTAVLPNAEISIVVVGLRNNTALDFSSDPNAIVAAINGLTLAPTKDLANVAEGIFETAKTLQKSPSKRRALVVASIHTTQVSATSTDQTLGELRKSGAVMYTIVLPGATAMTGNLNNLGDPEGSDKVLGDGPKQSGGRNVEIEGGASAGFQQRFEQFGQELAHQFAVTYTLPDGTKPDSKVSITTKRKGITLHAPTRIPDAQ
jgi:hypothetical protein